MAAILFPQHVIARKRDGGELDRAEIEAFVRGATDGSWADYQLSALLMAVFLRGMTARETAVADRGHDEVGDRGRPVRHPRAQGGQALDRRRRRQGVAAPRADGGGLRRRRPDGQRPRASATPAGRSTSSSRSRASGRASTFAEYRAQLGRIGARPDRPDGRDRPRRPQALRAARRHGHGRVHPAHLREHPQQEARRGDRRPRPRREVRHAAPS